METEAPKTPKPKRPTVQSRVVRANGRAFRLAVRDDDLADLMFAQADRERLERDGIRLARREFAAEFAPSRAATRTFCDAVAGLYARLMQVHGYHFVHQTWRKRRLSARQHLLREIAAVQPSIHPPREIERVTDLGRTARETWIRLAAGSDPNIAAGLEAELAALRSKWARYDDPPALGLLVDLLALAWLQARYLDLRYAHALTHDRSPEELASWTGQAQAAREWSARLHRDLDDGRRRLVHCAIERVKLDRLHQRVRKRNRKRDPMRPVPSAPPRTPR